MNSLFFNCAVIGLSSFFVSGISVWCMISCALRFNIVDAPNSTLKTQKAPVPYLGGLGVFLAFFSMLLMFNSITTNVLSIIVGSFVLMAIGLVDDLRAMTPLQKFVGQFVAVLLFLCGGIIHKKGTALISRRRNICDRGDVCADADIMV